MLEREGGRGVVGEEGVLSGLYLDAIIWTVNGSIVIIFFELDTLLLFLEEWSLIYCCGNSFCF